LTAVRPAPLALSDAQLEIVVSAANSVPPQWRTRFLEGIAARVSDDDVAHAVYRRLGWL